MPSPVVTSDELVQVQFTAETFNALATLHRDCSDCETAGGSTHAQTFPTANRVIVLSAAAIAILTGRIPPIGVRVSPNSTGGPDELRAQEDACCCSVEASPSVQVVVQVVADSGNRSTTPNLDFSRESPARICKRYCQTPEM